VTDDVDEAAFERLVAVHRAELSPTASPPTGRSRGATPRGSSAARTPTSRSPSSSSGRARASWSSAAGTLWNDLLTAGLIDELHLMVGPVVRGGGAPAFGDGLESPLRLLDTRTWEGSGNVLVRYAASPAS
jgi:RibD domain-containing protein